MFKQVLLIMALTCCGIAYSAGIYKWSDSKGNIQYTATPPPYGVEYELLTKQPQGTVREDSRQRPTGEKYDGEYTDTKQAQANTSDERKARWVENCEIAQANLDVLKSDRDVVQSDPDGNKVVLSGADRKQAIHQAQKDADYYCQP